MKGRAAGALVFPIVEAPEPGRAVEVASGVLWTRLPLPYPPHHVNAYLIEDTGGWMAIEAGLDNDATRDAWNAIFAGPLRGARLTRILPTHWHSDHLGSAGWLCDRFDAPLLMSESEYLVGLVRQLRSRDARDDLQRRFFLSHGMDAATTTEWVATGHQYLDMMAPVPAVYRRLVTGDALHVGGRVFNIHTACGHSPEEVLLYEPREGLFFGADQIMPRLAPSLAVQENDPTGNPLALYMASLDYIDRTIAPDALTLPGHELPFRSLPIRTEQLRGHYRGRCEILLEACSVAPRAAAELVGLLWRRPPDATWIGFVISEIVTYLNYLVSLNKLTVERDGGIIRYRAPDSSASTGASV